MFSGTLKSDYFSMVRIVNQNIVKMEIEKMLEEVVNRC